MRKAVSLRKGCQVEVCSEEDGFEGAILEDVPSKSGKKKKKLNVRYLDLETDNGSPLWEKAYKRFIRPVPPENLFSSTADFEEGSLVEAAHKDGWWTGVFVKKIDEDKHLVYFNSPPDLIHFKRRQLRHHYEWTKAGEWARPQNKQLSKNCGTVVEVMENTRDVVWVPAIVVKEMEDGRNTIVKSCKYLSWNDEIKPTRTVCSRNIKPIPPPISVESYELMETVEVFIDPGWRPGVVMQIHCEKQYTVCLQETNEQLVFNHSDLRPSKESIKKRFMRSDDVENAEATAIPEGEAVATRELSLAQGSGNGMVDHVRNETGTSDITATLTKQTVDKAQGKTSCEKTIERNANGDKMHEQHNCEDDSAQRRRGEVEHNSNLNEAVNESVSPVTTPQVTSIAAPLKQTETETDSTRHKMPDEEENNKVRSRKRKQHSDLNETEVTQALMALPFAKKSPYWKRCKSTEGYKSLPQCPHFSPLLEAKENIRELLAVGMMSAFYNLLDEVKDLDSSSVFNSLRDSFTELEKHGFDIAAPQSRISKAMSLKDERAKKAEEMQCFEDKIDENENESRKLVEEMAELKGKIIELQSQAAVAKEKKETVEMKSSGEGIGRDIEDVELEFLKTVSAPW